MKRFRLIRAVCSAVILASCSLSAAGAEMRPIAVFSLSGFERFVDDVAALGDSAGTPTLPADLGKFLRSVTKVDALHGIDKKRPLGIVVVTDGLAVVPIVFIPVTDLGKLLQSLEKMIGKARERPKGLWKIGKEKVTGYVRRQGDWAFLAQTEDNLVWLPDPEKLLHDLPRKYDVAFQFNFQHVPDVFRTMAIDFVRLAMRNNLPRTDGESEAQHEIRKRWATWRFRVLEHLLTDSRQITLGWTLDGRTNRTVFDIRLVPERNSKMARQLATLRKTKTRFGALATKNALMSIRVNWALDAAQVEKISADLRVSRQSFIRRIGEYGWIRSDEERKTFRRVAGTVLDVLEKTIQTGDVDLALAVEPTQSENPAVATAETKLERYLPLTLVAAAHVGKGAALEQAFESLARLGKQDSRFAGFQLNVTKIKGVPIHAVAFSEDKQRLMRRLFGKELKLYVAVSADSVWTAIGPRALAALDRAMTKQEIDVSPFEFHGRLGDLLNIAGATTEQSLLKLISTELGDADDRVTLTIEADQGGLHIRAVGREGVLRLGGFALDKALLFWRLRSIFGL